VQGLAACTQNPAALLRPNAEVSAAARRAAKVRGRAAKGRVREQRVPAARAWTMGCSSVSCVPGAR
jgi:hypothetical protein